MSITGSGYRELVSELPPLFAEDHACARCGLAYTELDIETCLALVADSTDVLAGLLPTLDETTLRGRPWPGRWSAIEYACHVRDVLLTFAIRIHRGVVEDRPVLDPMYADWRAERFGYGRLPVAHVVAALASAADGFAAEVQSVPEDAWDRTVVRRPEELRTVRWLVRQAAHECVHHLADVTRPLEPPRRTSDAAARPSPAGS
jgi:hypothetical protein